MDLLAETTAIAAISSANSDLNSSKNEIWLCGQFPDSQSLPKFPVYRENTGKIC